MVQAIIKETIDAYDVLKAANDLSPRNHNINCALCNLFDRIEGNNTSRSADLFFKDRTIQEVCPSFRELCQEAEERMEYYFSENFINRVTLEYKDLEEFWYWKNYYDLAVKEINILKEHKYDFSMQKGEKIAFVGQGPLPMTMLIFHHLTKTPCVGIDIAAEASLHADLLSSKIGFNMVTNDVCDGALYDYSSTPIIFLASMIPNKKAVLEQIKKTRLGKETFVNVRTAENLSTLFYKEFDLKLELPASFEVLGKTTFDSKTINTTYCLKC